MRRIITLTLALLAFTAADAKTCGLKAHQLTSGSQTYRRWTRLRSESGMSLPTME